MILLNNARIFNGERFFKGSVLIENGKISSIGEVKKAIDKNAIVIDCKNGILTSGLVDIHGHFLEMGNEEFGFPADLSCIPFGVTYAVDACAEHTNLSLVDNLCVQTKVLVHIGAKGEEIDIENAEKKLALYKDRAIGLKVYFDTCLENGFSFEHLKKACDFARAKGLKIMVHCSNSPVTMKEIVDCLSEGDILTHCYHGGVHTIEEDDYIAYKKAKEKGVVLDAGMAGWVHTDFAVLRKAIENGYIPDVISSDITKFSAYMRGGNYGLPMCMSIARLCGMREIDIFKATTINAAKAVNQEKWFGLRVGENATLSIVKWADTQITMQDKAGNALVSKKGYLCKITVKNGQIIYRN